MKKFLALFSLICIGVYLFRRKITFATSATGNSLLWEITGAGLSQPSYLLGTMHMMCAADARLSGNTLFVLKKVAQVYLEADIQNAAMSAEMFDNLRNTGIELSTILPADEYELVKSFFETHQPHLPFYILEKQFPMLLTSGLYELFLNCEQTNGIELVLMSEAAKRKLPIRGLETLEFQVSIFSKIPYSQQASELVKTIQNIEKYKAALSEMISVYKLQDIQKLYELSATEEAGTAAYADILIDDRNNKWADLFTEIAHPKPTLFAVGAGHLGGTNGLINLLRKKGYRIRPLAND